MRRLSGSDLWQLARASVRGWIDDAAPSMGASLAFYTLFSIAPLLIVVVSLVGVFVGHDVAQTTLIAQLEQFTGPKAARGIEALLEAAGTREGGVFSAAMGALTLLVGATTLFAELQSDLNRIWRYKAPKAGGLVKFLRARLAAFTLVMGVGLLLLGSLVASAIVAVVGRSWFPDADLLLNAAEFAISFLVVTGLFAMIYKLLPARRIAWGDVWVGAAVTSALFWIGKIAIALYISRSAVGDSFGTAGALVAVVAWVYYTSQVFFLGAEFTREYALRHGSKREEAVAIRAAEAANDEALVARAERLVRGDDPVLERPRKEA